MILARPACRQKIVLRAITSGRYAAHLAVLRKRYRNKARAMVTAMKRYFPRGAGWWEPRGGLYYWAQLPASLPSGLKSKLFRTAVARDILYVPGGLCYVEDASRPRPDHEMRPEFRRWHGI